MIRSAKSLVLPVDPTRFIVAGYASVFGVEDSYGEIVDAGAFADSIRESQEVPLFWSHEGLGFFGNQPPMGKTYLLREDDHGLYYEATLAPTQRAFEIASLLAGGAVGSASFAYEQLGWEIDTETGITHLTKLGLMEVSVTTWGANPAATSELRQIDQAESSAAEIFAGEFHTFIQELRAA